MTTQSTSVKDLLTLTEASTKIYSRKDASTLSNSTEVAPVHSHIEWRINFESKKISGYVDHKMEVLVDGTATADFDSSNIKITSPVQVNGQGTTYVVAERNPALGAKISVSIPKNLQKAGSIFTVRFAYYIEETSSALQWLPASATKDKKHPFLFTQSQAIHARSLFPCMDSPGIKAPYTANVTAPSWCTVLMSALPGDEGMKTTSSVAGESITYRWNQPVPVPAYLIAIAAGSLVGKDINERVRIYAEPDVVDQALFEFSETEEFLKAAEELTGCPYQWTRYDVLCLPPSFPYGGMENPCLTFATPTLLAGDKSLADVIAHEIAHSWTGNLVTNHTWDHFWLNEGWTVWLERKICSKVKNSAEHGKLSAQIGWRHLKEDVSRLGAEHPFTRLVWPLTSSEDPDDAYSSVPYEKGFNLLYFLEHSIVGEDLFALFVTSYIDRYKFKTVSTGEFRDHFVSFFQQLLSPSPTSAPAPGSGPRAPMSPDRSGSSAGVDVSGADSSPAPGGSATKKKNKNRGRKGKKPAAGEPAAVTSTAASASTADPDAAATHATNTNGATSVAAVKRSAAVPVDESVCAAIMQRIQSLDWNALFQHPGMPVLVAPPGTDAATASSGLPDFRNSLSSVAEALAQRWIACSNSGSSGSTSGAKPGSSVASGGFSSADIQGWTTQQTSVFLEQLIAYAEEYPESSSDAGNDAAPCAFSAAILQTMDHAYGFTASGNAEIKFRWQSLCISSFYDHDEYDVSWIVPHIVQFITSQGRMKYIRPLYRALSACVLPEVKSTATETFASFKDMYHPIARKMVQADLEAQAKLDAAAAAEAQAEAKSGDEGEGQDEEMFVDVATPVSAGEGSEALDFEDAKEGDITPFCSSLSPTPAAVPVATEPAAATESIVEESIVDSVVESVAEPKAAEVAPSPPSAPAPAAASVVETAAQEADKELEKEEEKEVENEDIQEAAPSAVSDPTGNSNPSTSDSAETVQAVDAADVESESLPTKPAPTSSIAVTTAPLSTETVLEGSMSVEPGVIEVVVVEEKTEKVEGKEALNAEQMAQESEPETFESKAVFYGSGEAAAPNSGNVTQEGAELATGASTAAFIAIGVASAAALLWLAAIRPRK